MKKKTSLTFLFLSILLFLFIYVYTETNLINQSGYFNYHVSDFIGYMFFWSFTLLILSLLASKLDIYKYRIWLIISVVISIISIFIAYAIGGGNGAIISFDGEMVTWFFVGLYSFVSIIYFIVQFFKNRKNNS